MKKTALLILATSTALVAQNSFPLPASASSTTHVENTAPFVVPLRMTQTLVTNRNTLMAQGLPTSLINWDMIALDPSSRYVFVPCENFGGGGGVFRYDTQTGVATVIWHGNNAGVNNRNSNPATFNASTDETAANDPCSWTPWGTIVFGEEATGGRFFECTNPLSPNGPFNIVWHAKIPAVSQEGMRFDAQGNLYFIDEDNSGSIYKYVPVVAGDLSSGQTFVLSIDGYAAHPNAVPAENFNSTSNRLTTRVGPATWVPMTDVNGNQTTTVNPFTFVTAPSGRAAADEVVGTPFGRPEDMDIGRLANGNEVIYVALTSENRVISIELLTGTSCIVRDFVNYDTINLATGMDVNPAQQDPFTNPGGGTVLNNPDNIAIDAWGGVYVIEDSNPGDVWKCIDADGDGVAESLGLFITLGVGGSEPTGMIFDPNHPYRFLCCVQHPSSGNEAIWAFETRPYAGSNQDLDLLTGISAMPRTGPGEFVKSAYPLDIVNIQVKSTDNTYTGRPFAVLLQAFGTGSGTVPFLPPLWMSPYYPIVSLVGGPAGNFTAVLPFGGSNTAVQVPAFLSGISVMTQGVVVDQQGRLVLTDGHEVVLR